MSVGERFWGAWVYLHEVPRDFASGPVVYMGKWTGIFSLYYPIYQPGFKEAEPW